MKKIIFLHHSTGKSIWLGKTNRYINKLTGSSDVLKYFREYNRKNSADLHIEESVFPRKISIRMEELPL